MPGREMPKNCKTIEMDGLLWGAIGYGIKKLQLMAVVEDDQDKLCEFEDFIQSMDIAALNMI